MKVDLSDSETQAFNYSILPLYQANWLLTSISSHTTKFVAVNPTWLLKHFFKSLISQDVKQAWIKQNLNFSILTSVIKSLNGQSLTLCLLQIILYLELFFTSITVPASMTEASEGYSSPFSVLGSVETKTLILLLQLRAGPEHLN